MRTSEIRQRWLDYFAKNGHELRDSVSLISPDPSVLFTIAGMVPFIPYIIGTEPAPWPRVASVQKCIRTNDIEEVGKTTRHGTFFQMCGNFSFGDYFKEGASKYAWELLTSSQSEGGYGLDGEKLWVTIWEEDDEAADIWLRDIGIDAHKVQRLPREDIFWDTGQPGPAGPCAEIHYDRGPDFGPEGGPMVDVAGDRFLEIWNLVFDQYLRGEGSGKDYPLLGELDEKSIDTGLGLERLSFLLQGKDNMYEIDEVFPVIQAAQDMSGRIYKSSPASAQDDVRMRVVADHVRSALMLIGDGVRPANEGRGYVLRRLVRRAVRSMKLLGVNEPVMPTLLPVSLDVMKSSYPELEANWGTISQVAYAEEDAFRHTLDTGTTILDTAVSKAKAQTTGATLLSGDDAFALHDTYGFPIDLTIEIAAEKGVEVDEQRFRDLMNEQRQRARADALAKKTGHVDSRVYHEIFDNLAEPIEFTGYTQSSTSGKLIGLLVDGKPVVTAQGPCEVEVILDSTPFYAEAGGQLADQGTIRFAGGAVMDVIDCQAPIKGMPIHRGTLTEGTVVLDEPAHASIDTHRRLAIARAHTSTHVIHQLLMDRLGDAASQAGSENSPSRMRFDFRNATALPSGMLEEVEEDANIHVAKTLEVRDYQMPIEEAKALGAQALFGEKYGNIVRVVDIGDGWSRELCGGTHVPTTGSIGRIVVMGESSIGSGIRRIEALVGDGAYGFQAKEHALVSQLTQMLGARPDELAERLSSTLTRLKEAEKELDKLRRVQLLAQAPQLLAEAQTQGNTRLISSDMGVVASADDLRSLVLDVRERLGEEHPAVIALIGLVKEQPVLVIATNAAARNAGVKAGALVKAGASKMGGGGGGKDDLAQGGGSKPEGIPDALEAIAETLKKDLNS
ncbi:MAG: alanine--tRNA ligase [Actinomycetaceae bacterium]|nr:alanine--tRNA ligase [Actinomycetaceae bacterium]